jgi:hypothetical protein
VRIQKEAIKSIIPKKWIVEAASSGLMLPSR